MKELAISLMVGFLKSFLERVAQNLWDAVWAELIQAAAEAEQKWKESGQGEVKREWVIEKILEYINSQTKLSWLYKKLISTALGMIVDSMVKAFNDQMGKDWGSKVAELEDYLDDKIPFIK